MATTDPLTGYEPNLLGIPDDFEVLPSIFQGSDSNQLYNLRIDREESANAWIDDEHITTAVASPLFTQESEAEASLAQTYHSDEESLLRGAQSDLARTEQPVVWQTRQKSSRESDDERIKTMLQIQKEQILAEARAEILKYENKASLTEDYIRC